MRSVFLVALISLGVSTLHAQSIDQLRKGFDERCEQAAAARDAQLEKLNGSYLGALQRLLEKTKTSGKLDAALPIHQEIEAIRHADAQLPPLPDTALPDLKQMRVKYQDGHHQILKTHATTLDGLAAKMEAALKSRETELTKAGKIDEAVAARDSLAELAKDKDLLAARDLLKLGGVSGKGKPALQLRRHGDNLEVLVYYDRFGKVSMDSPVENVREKTGPAKELGDTKAKVLGEFVGATGYQVDPYQAFRHIFDGKDLGGFGVRELLAKPGHVEGKEKGLRLSFGPGAPNQYGFIDRIIPPVATKCGIRITVRYFIPKENRAIEGFRFVHGAGSAVGDKVFQNRGEWVEEQATGESAHDSETLLFYPNLPAGAKPAEAKGDYLVIGSIRIEYVRFSAFVERRFGDTGAPLEINDDPLAQPRLVSSGALPSK